MSVVSSCDGGSSGSGEYIAMSTGVSAECGVGLLSSLPGS